MCYLCRSCTLGVQMLAMDLWIQFVLDVHTFGRAGFKWRSFCAICMPLLHFRAPSAGWVQSSLDLDGHMSEREDGLRE